MTVGEGRQKPLPKDALEVMAMMKEVTGKRPKMWGASIIGFGLTVYIMPGFSRYGKLVGAGVLVDEFGFGVVARCT